MLLDPNKKHDWNIISAMRGPDDNMAQGADAAKIVTTCVLRFLFGVVIGGYPSIKSPDEAQAGWYNLPAYMQNDAVVWFNHPDRWHYRMHLSKAFDSPPSMFPEGMHDRAMMHVNWLKEQGFRL